jgi:hypothetical protein
MKNDKKKSLQFVQEPLRLTELNMSEIKGGTDVLTYMDCGQHHDVTELGSRLLTVV